MAFVLVFGCGLALGAYILADRLERTAQLDRFEKEAEVRFDQIEKRIESTVSVVRSLVGLYAASNSVEREEFRQFIRSIGVDHSVQALEWIPRVPLSQRAAFEEAARQNGFAEFSFTERGSQGTMVRAREREEYYPVYFVEPLAGNERAMGFDLGSNTARLEALEKARDSGRMVATSRITLVQETGDQYGFLAFIPMYRTGARVDTIAERHTNLIGFGLGVFRIGDLVNGALKNISAGKNPLAISIFDQSAPEASRTLYPKDERQNDDADRLSSLRFTRQLDIAGRDWALVAAPTAAFYRATGFLWRPWAVLLVGILITGLIALYLRLMANRSREIEGLVQDRTAKLSNVNRELEVQISERKQAEAALTKRAAELGRSNEELQRFAAVASHELQEPLRKVQTFGDLLKSQYAQELDSDGQDCIARMCAASERMQELIADLLSFSQVSGNTQTFASVDLNGVGQSVISDLEVSIESNGAILEVAELPTIDANPMQIRQLFQNLIGNAIKYRRQAVTPRIEITAHVDRVDGLPGEGSGPEHCRILFKDNGMGFDPQYADRIFGIFQRLHNRTKYNGTGIGLAICRKIADQHGGTISAEGRIDKGATFTVTLPISQERQAAHLAGVE